MRGFVDVIGQRHAPYGAGLQGHCWVSRLQADDSILVEDHCRACQPVVQDAPCAVCPGRQSRTRRIRYRAIQAGQWRFAIGHGQPDWCRIIDVQNVDVGNGNISGGNTGCQGDLFGNLGSRGDGAGISDVGGYFADADEPSRKYPPAGQTRNCPEVGAVDSISWLCEV